MVQQLNRLELWQTVLRQGIFPQLSDEQLTVLRTAFETDDPRLIQGATTTPLPLLCVRDWPAEAACVLGFCGWVGDGLKTVGEVEEFFGKVCFECDRLLGEPAAVRHLLNWFDDAPRDEMRRLLLKEVWLEHYRRRATVIRVEEACDVPVMVRMR